MSARTQADRDHSLAVVNASFAAFRSMPVAEAMPALASLVASVILSIGLLPDTDADCLAMHANGVREKLEYGRKHCLAAARPAGRA